MPATVTTPDDLKPLTDAITALDARVTKLEGGVTPPATGESADGTTITAPGQTITDAGGHKFTLVDSGAAGLGLQIGYDGVVDHNTSFVILGLYSKHAFYQENVAHNFYTGSPGNWTQTSDPRSPPAPSVGGVATRAYDLVDAAGVVCHFSWRDLPEWADWSKCIDSIKFLGLWNVRDGAAEFAVDAFKGLVANKFKLLYGVCGAGGYARDLAASWNNGMNAVPGLAACVEVVEWSNEVNGSQKIFTAAGASSEGNTADAGRAYRQCMSEYSAIMRPLVGNTKLAASSLAFMGQDMTPYLQGVGDLRQFIDVGMCHDYFVPDPNNTVYDRVNLPIAQGGGAQTARATMPDKEWITGECGYTTVQDNNGNYSTYMNVSELAQKSLELEGFLAFFVSGTATSRMKRCYKYALIDQAGWSNTTPGSVSGEGSFGLFRSDRSPKPAATTIHNFTQLMRDAGATAQTFTTTKLDYTLSGDVPAKTKQLLVQFSDGHYAVIAWSGDTVWNNQRDVPPTTHHATLNLPAVAKSISYTDPTISPTPSGVHSNVQTYAFDLRPWPTVLLVNI